MSMNYTMVAVTMMALMAAPLQARPVHHGRAAGGAFYDEARVTDVQPVYRVVSVPDDRRECWTEEVAAPNRWITPGVGTVLGGVAGAVVGHEVGRNDIKPLTTAIGAVLGAGAGHSLMRNRYRPYYTSQERCRTVRAYREEERMDGYRVTYRYRGHTFVRRMSHDPGEHVRVRVSVDPDD